MMIEALKHSVLKKLQGFFRADKLFSSLSASLSHHQFINWERNGAGRNLVSGDKRLHQMLRMRMCFCSTRWSIEIRPD